VKNPPTQASGADARLNRKEARPLHHLIASCLNDGCRDTALIDVSNYPDDIEVPSFQRRAKFVKCGGKRRCPANCKEQPLLRGSRAGADNESRGEPRGVSR
jgi:hypothetical protein